LSAAQGSTLRRAFEEKLAALRVPYAFFDAEDDVSAALRRPDLFVGSA
jgi:hypothetical protein